ncbi:hypothetical protein AB0C34_17915 [Nocardia sp. NPDC049220]|uniref:hypothetical protein n=1 Tax=Nocardia sp. NPDC049220 TaxID=3155273 RepID=UPI0033E09731
MTNAPVNVRMLKAVDAATAATAVVGALITEAAFRSAANRSPDPLLRRPGCGADGEYEWPEPAVLEWAATYRATEDEAEAWGLEHGLMTARQSAAATGTSIGAFHRAVSAKTLHNPAPDPLSKQELEQEVPRQFRRWAWYRSSEVRHWIHNRPGTGNRSPKRIMAGDIGPEEWTAHDCARAAGMDEVYQWHRLCRKTPGAPRPHRKVRGAFIWDKRTVLEFLKSLTIDDRCLGTSKDTPVAAPQPG